MLVLLDLTSFLGFQPCHTASKCLSQTFAYKILWSRNFLTRISSIEFITCKLTVVDQPVALPWGMGLFVQKGEIYFLPSLRGSSSHSGNSQEIEI